jgi:hypothetical protein
VAEDPPQNSKQVQEAAELDNPQHDGYSKDPKVVGFQELAATLPRKIINTCFSWQRWIETYNRIVGGVGKWSAEHPLRQQGYNVPWLPNANVDSADVFVLFCFESNFITRLMHSYLLPPEERYGH